VRVLLIEDDDMIGAAMSDALRDASHAVDWVRDGADALKWITRQSYKLVLLDLGLPKMDGQQVLTRIRALDAFTPIIVVTARDALESRVSGLDSGADDYLMKPFDMPELLARIRAVVRRGSGTGGPLLTNGVLSLDPATREASIDGRSTRLSNREFGLLHSLMLRPGAILSRTELEDHIYGWNEEVESNAVEFLIHSLRKKLGTGAIKNVRGVGWMVSKES
jgi:two-component system, OmpR family, response regulator